MYDGAVIRIDTAQRRSRIGVRHLLRSDARAADASTVADGLVALHSSDPATVYLSAAVRMADPSIDAIASSLYVERTLVRHHAMRRTLWVMSPTVARLAHASSTRALAAPQERRLAQVIELNNVSSDGARWIAAAKSELIDAVSDLGPVSTRQLGAAFPKLAVPLHFQGGKVSAHARVLLLLGFDGEIVRSTPSGSWTSSQYRWSTATAWIPGGFGDLDARVATAELVDRYLRAYGPATAIDVQWWFGLTKTATLRALNDVDAVEVLVESGSAWMSSSDQVDQTDTQPWVALLPGLDPTVMGWKERAWYLDQTFVPLLFDRNGNAGPTVWMDGRIVGGWAQHTSGDIRFHILDDAAHDRLSEIDAAADSLASFYGDSRHKVRFPSPIQKALLRP